MKSQLASLLIVSPLIVSCSGVSQPAEPASSVLAHWSGVQGGAGQAGTRVIRTVEEWRTLWQQVGRDVPRPLEVSREMGLAVFLGERNTGGYTVDVVRTRIQGGRFMVEYRETAPAPDALTTQALTYPWAFAVVSKSDLPVAWTNLTSTSGSDARNSGPPPPPRGGARQQR